MVLILFGIAFLIGLGVVMRASRLAIGSLVGLVLIAVLIIQTVLPFGHPLREATGGSLTNWAIIGGLALLVALYVFVLQKLRARAAQNAPVPAHSGPFSEAELERYARHIVLHDIGGAGQQKLKNAKVLVIGAGGLGSPALLYLAAAGIGRIGIIDDDVVSLSNLQRQVIHRDADLDVPKVFSAERAIKALNPHVEVRPYNRRLTEADAATLFADFDLILDGTDTFAARAMINRASVATGTPLVSGAISQWEGQITLFTPGRGQACYACIFPEAPAPGLVRNCSEVGVIGALPGIIGAMMASEAIKFLTGAGKPLVGEMLIFDALHMESRKMKLARAATCPVCGD